MAESPSLSPIQLLAELQRLARAVKDGRADARYWGGPTIPPTQQIEAAQKALDRLAALPDIQEEPAWQPIETAPDRTKILVCWIHDQDDYEVDFAQWITQEGYYSCCGNLNRKCERQPHQWPTHWMPLPAPPIAMESAR